MERHVRAVVAVEQIQGYASDACLPCAQPDFVAGKLQLEADELSLAITHGHDRQFVGRIVGIKRSLNSIGIDRLAEIALLIEQPDADNRNAQIAAGLELVAGHVTKAARVDWQRLAQAELHAEIGDVSERRALMHGVRPVRGDRKSTRLNSS